MVRYTYDGKRRVTAVELNGTKNYVTYSYTDASESNPESTVTTVLGDPSTTESVTSIVTKDVHGNTKMITQKKKAEEAGVLVDREQTVTFKYDSKNRLEKISGRENGTTETFTYDALDNLSKYVYTMDSDKDGEVSDGDETIVEETYAYNTNRQLASKTVDGKTYTYTYKDDTAKSLESVSVGTLGFAPKLDCLGRNKGKTISFITKNEDNSETWTKIAEEQITYLKFGDHATNIPATVYYGDKKNGSYAFSDHFKYKYDSMGNITEIRENGELYAKYTYDTIGRLVREDNKKLGKTTVFTYDANGNILCRKEYPFTLLETEKLDELDCDTFTYTYDGDKLLSYNGEECTYDAIGNPEKYRGLDADFDNGRQLKQLGDTTFTYDNLGRRTDKNDIAFTYDANGNLIRQNNGISFIYDASGVCGICYGNSTYFYRKDILGNIVALLDANGEIVAKYTYDAWGNHTVTDTNGNVITDENHIANLNPFRYRGYYYDIGIGLYFLKTRYYDPEIGRFITIDDISYLDPESINGLNLYAYCLNNPIMLTDRYGCTAWWEWLIAGVIVTGLIVGSIFTGGLLGAAFVGAALGAGMSLGTQALRGELSWGQFFLDTGVGAITGLIGGSGVSRSVATILGGVIGAVSNLASQLIEGTSWSNISVMQILIAGAFGALSSYIGGAGARNRDAINEGKGVQKAIAQLNKVVRRIANGTRYKSLTTAQAAFTNAMNGLTGAIQSQMSAMFATAMISYGVSTVVFSGIDAWFDEDKYWLF